jgi:threonine dehydrogenase-like Zn-dependent dehydrogenase
MKAAVLEKYGQFEWKTINKPVTGDREVLVKVNYAGICGSDQHIFKGEFVPRTTVPFVPGHEFAGIVVEVGKEVRNVTIGEQVAVDPIIWCGECPACRINHYPACVSLKLIGVDMNGGFGEYINVPEHTLYKVSKKIPARHAALVEVLSIGFHACNRAGVKTDDTVVIWGAGKVGQSILQAVRTKTRNSVILIDILEQRLALAKKYYPDVNIIDARKEDPVKAIMTLTGNKGVDVAFEAIGHFEVLEGRANPVRSCIQSIRGAGTVCVLGLGNEPTPLLMKELIWKEAKLVASRVSHGEFLETIAHLEKGDLKPDALVTDILHPKDIQSAFKMLEEEPANHLKILLDFSSL